MLSQYQVAAAAAAAAAVVVVEVVEALLHKSIKCISHIQINKLPITIVEQQIVPILVIKCLCHSRLVL